jgi:hypothetical protein
MPLGPYLWLNLPDLYPDEFFPLETKDIRDLVTDIVDFSHGVEVG